MLARSQPNLSRIEHLGRSWLVIEATAHSKMEHQQSERVKPGRGGSSGGGGGGGYQDRGGKPDGGEAYGKSDEVRSHFG